MPYRSTSYCLLIYKAASRSKLWVKHHTAYECIFHFLHSCATLHIIYTLASSFSVLPTHFVMKRTGHEQTSTATLADRFRNQQAQTKASCCGVFIGRRLCNSYDRESVHTVTFSASVKWSKAVRKSKGNQANV